MKSDLFDQFMPIVKLNVSKIISIIVSLLFYAESFYTQKIFINPAANDKPLQIISKLILMVAIFFVSYGICKKFQALKLNGIQKSDRLFVIFFVFFLVWFMFWLIGMWPGIMDSDTYVTLQQIRDLYVNKWLSYVTSLIYLVLFYVFPAPVVVPIVQVILTSLIFASLMKLAYDKGIRLWIIALFSSILTFNVPIIVNTIFLTRDSIFGIIHIWLAIYAFRCVLEKKYSLPLLITFTVFLSLLRMDGILLLFIIPALLWIKRIFKFRQVVIFVLTAGIAFSFFNYTFPKVIKVYNNPMGSDNAYAMSVVTNPLGYYLQHNFYSKTKEQDIKVMDKVVDVDKVAKVSNPYDIPAFWDGAWKWDATANDYSRFEKLFVRLTVNNIPLFLSDRIMTFMAATSFSDGGFMFNDGARDGLQNLWDGVSNIPKNSLFFNNFAPDLLKVQKNFLNKTKQFDGIKLSGKFVFWNYIPSMLMILVVMILYPLFPITSSMSVIIMYRLPVVFLTEPASTFKYLYSMFIFGFIVILLAMIEKKVKKNILN